jgi:hypothetical protein
MSTKTKTTLFTKDTNNNLYVQVVEGSTVKHQIIQLTKKIIV